MKEKIAARLRAARVEAGFTQREVGNKLGYHRPTITELEAGRRKLTTEELITFSKLYGIQPLDIIKDL